MVININYGNQSLNYSVHNTEKSIEEGKNPLNLGKKVLGVINYFIDSTQIYSPKHIQFSKEFDEAEKFTIEKLIKRIYKDSSRLSQI